MSDTERVKRYQAKCDAIMLRPPKAKGETIRQAAAAAGESLQGYILQAVQERMERDDKGGKPNQELCDLLDTIAEAKAQE